MEEWTEWLQVAEHDIEVAVKTLGINEPDVCAFYCHQAIEKAFKALLLQTTERFPSIHNLDELARLTNAPLRIAKLCAELNPVYIESRYIVEQHETTIEAREALGHARAIMKWIKTKLPSSMN